MEYRDVSPYPSEIELLWDLSEAKEAWWAAKFFRVTDVRIGVVLEVADIIKDQRILY